MTIIENFNLQGLWLCLLWHGGNYVTCRSIIELLNLAQCVTYAPFERIYDMLSGERLT